MKRSAPMGRLGGAATTVSVLAFSAALAASGDVAGAAQAPWPMALHDNRHSGTAAVAGPTSGQVLWTRDLGGKITPRPAESYSSSSVFGGLAYYGDNSGALHVVREPSGSLVATDHDGSKGIWAAQAIDSKGDVYFGTRGKHIYGFGPHGTKLFDLTASAPIDSYPALTGNGASSSATRQGRCTQSDDAAQ